MKQPGRRGTRKSTAISRRNLLKYGFAGGGALAMGGAGSIIPQAVRAKGGGSFTSPPTTAFMDALPIAPIATPSTAPLPQLSPSRIPPAVVNAYYELDTREGLHKFHSQLPPTSIWGYNGITPGPTIMSQANTTTVIRFNNNLPAHDPVGIGLPITAVHRHGGFQAPEDDGYPFDFVNTGFHRDYVFLHPAIESLHWYHDHSIDITAENVYRGLAGFYLNFDEVDSIAGELDLNPNALRLPGRMVTDGGVTTRKYDVALAFQDRTFDSNGQLVYDSFSHNGFIGDKFVVNGAIQPFYNVEPRKYRFRFLNGSNARQYEFILRDGKTGKLLSFDYIIGTDDRLFEHPLTNIESFRIASSERVQCVIDFSKYAGKEILLVNRLDQTEGRKPNGIVSPGTPILKFVVSAAAVADPSQVPATLRAIPDDERPANVLKQGVRVRRQFDFGRGGGAWVINGELFDENRISAKPVEDQYEIWDLNAGGGWEHPVHIHLSNFFIISRDGKPPAPIEQGWKDVVVVGGDRGSVQVLIKFSGFRGKYVFHCHTVEHEDARMMANFEVQAKKP